MNSAVYTGGLGRLKSKAGSAVFISSSLFAAVLLLFLLFPEYVREGVGKGLDLCSEAILPSLFPFAVLASYFVGAEYPRRLEPVTRRFSRRCFRCGGSVASVWLAGLVCGFPVGAKLASEAYGDGQLNRAEAEKAAAFSNNPSPAFTLGFCGGLFESAVPSFVLFGILWFSSFLAGFAVCRLFPGRGREEVSPSPASLYPLPLITRSCVSGGSAMVTVCSFAVFFSAASALAEGLLPFSLNGEQLPFFRGLFELTSGIEALGVSGLNGFPEFVAAAFLLSFSGLCANMQAMSFLAEKGLSVKPYVVGRALTVLFSVSASLPIAFLLQSV